MAVVLIAEDDVDVSTVLRRVFSRAGFSVLTAADGLTALQAAVVHAPDVVLTDLDMPGMSGLQLCEAIRADARLQDMPVGILSGSLRHGDPRAAQAQACGVWLKPFANATLLAAIRGLLAVGRHDHRAEPSLCPLVDASVVARTA